MQKFKFRNGSGYVFSDDSPSKLVTSSEPMQVDPPSPQGRPALFGVDMTTPMMHLTGQPDSMGWVLVSDLEAIPEDPAAVQTSDDGSSAAGWIFGGLGLLGAAWYAFKGRK